MEATVGRIVHYTLSGQDAAMINQRRDDAHAFRRRVSLQMEGGEIAAGYEGRTGHVEHFGNEVSEGDVYPAVVVRRFGGLAAANLKVLLDGNDDYWATSRSEGEGPGFWAWPARV